MRMILAALIAMTAAPLAAQTQPGNATAPAKDEPKICKRLEQTGSRMASKRVCHTASEWQAIDSDNDRVGGGSNLRSKPN